TEAKNCSGELTVCFQVCASAGMKPSSLRRSHGVSWRNEGPRGGGGPPVGGGPPGGIQPGGGEPIGGISPPDGGAAPLIGVRKPGPDVGAAPAAGPAGGAATSIC